MSFALKKPSHRPVKSPIKSCILAVWAQRCLKLVPPDPGKYWSAEGAAVEVGNFLRPRSGQLRYSSSTYFKLRQALKRLRRISRTLPIWCRATMSQSFHFFKTLKANYWNQPCPSVWAAITG